MIKIAAILIASASLTACATLSQRSDRICKEVGAFANSVPTGETRKVRLETAWGSGLGGREDLLYEKQCEHHDYEPAKALCQYLIENTSTEFMAINVSRILSCLPGAPPFRQVAETSVHSLSGTVSSFSFRGVREDTEVTVAFSTGCRDCDPFLEVAAERVEFDD